MVMGKKGGILVKNWAFLKGTRFIASGPNGICETTATGDDEQAIAVGAGRPNTRAVEPVVKTFPREQLKGDDLLRGRKTAPASNDSISAIALTRAVGRLFKMHRQQASRTERHTAVAQYLERARDLLDAIAFDDVADAHIFIVLERHAALLAGRHLAHLVLEPLQ